MARYDTRTRVSAKSLEQSGSFDLSDHSLCFAARDGAASQGHIVVDINHHTATTEQEHRAQLRVARHADDALSASASSRTAVRRWKQDAKWRILPATNN